MSLNLPKRSKAIKASREPVLNSRINPTAKYRSSLYHLPQSDTLWERRARDANYKIFEDHMPHNLEEERYYQHQENPFYRKRMVLGINPYLAYGQSRRYANMLPVLPEEALPFDVHPDTRQNWISYRKGAVEAGERITRAAKAYSKRLYNRRMQELQALQVSEASGIMHMPNGPVQMPTILHSQLREFL